MAVDRLMRYWHTLRHLRPVQFYGRLWFRLARPKIDSRPAPLLRSASAPWKACFRPASMNGPAQFRFLGVEREVAARQDWNRSDWPKLWLYNAHYFDDLVAEGFKERASWHRDLLSRWVHENPPGSGNGWEPYPTSLRIVNWIKSALSGSPLTDAERHSLAIQTRWLRQRLEIHLLGNHLWANAKALVFAGAFFEGAESDAWRGKGIALIERELDEQILADGGHFERSPMYHAIVLEDVLDLVQLADVYPDVLAANLSACLRMTARRMLRWLRIMSHPDGGIAFFNDAAFGIAPEVSALAEYAHSLGLAPDDVPLDDIEALSDSGYVRLQNEKAVLIADVGVVGPDYLVGHAHADTLSFELSLQGQRVLVNGGTSTYAIGAQRLRERGTAMHNTVEVNGLDSSEVWSSFRVARRARPFAITVGRDASSLWVEAAHDGYHRLAGKPIHRRRWELKSEQLRVLDFLSGEFDSATARFRFAPGWRAELASSDGGKSVCDTLELAWKAEQGAELAVLEGTWHPHFGAGENCEVLTARFTSAALETTFSWN